MGCWLVQRLGLSSKSDSLQLWMGLTSPFVTPFIFVLSGHVRELGEALQPDDPAMELHSPQVYHTGQCDTSAITRSLLSFCLIL